MSQDNIFREVDEELRRDRMRDMWRRYGPFVIAAAVAVVLLVAINEGWSWYQQSNSARASEQLYAALEMAEAGDTAGAQEALNAVIAEGTGGYPTLARFKQAALLAKDGKPAEAVAAYDALAGSETNPRLRELALVLAANILVDHGSLEEVNQRVQSVATPESPLRNTAREAIGLAQYKAGDLLGARETFEAVLSDPQTSSDVGGRMRMYVQQLVAEGALTEEEQAAAAASAADAVDAALSETAEPALPPAETPASAPAAPEAAPADAAAPQVQAEAPAAPAPAADDAPALNLIPPVLSPRVSPWLPADALGAAG